MSVKGNTKKWVTSDTQVPIAEWVTEEVSLTSFGLGSNTYIIGHGGSEVDD